MIRPKPAPARPDTPDIPEPEAETPAQEESEPDTLSKATGWLRRSLNLGKKTDINPEAGSTVSPPGPPVEEEPTQAMSLFDIEEAERTAQQKPRTQRAPIRFVLKFSHGPQITVGEMPGIIGVKPGSESDPAEVQRITVDDDTDTVAPEHLEFGVKNGVLWVKDLKTVNGTVVEEPGSRPLQCIPYDTYSVVRGSTVTLGSLSFTLH
ncbi:MAG TPA: FHA domain-containing protein [Pontimonas sp.]|nr:FHA domain-containing protein [Pontimonas sp.]